MVDESARPQVNDAEPRVLSVLEMAKELIAMPTVTNCAEERLHEVHACGRFIADFLDKAGLEVRLYDDGAYPSILAGFPGTLTAPVTLGGHFDVVQPEPDDRQFEPRIEGDYLWGRGSADMKTVVASYMVWMGEAFRQGPPFPPVNLLLVGNEENGETEKWGTPHVLEAMKVERGWTPEFMVLGERTGEGGDEAFGSVCTANRGILRMRIEGRGERGHSGTSAVPMDLVDRLIEARTAVAATFRRHLTLSSTDGWQSNARVPFLNVGEPGVYNITAGEGVLGLEVRPIPEDDLSALVSNLKNVAVELGLEAVVEVADAGIACPPGNPYLGGLLAAVEDVSGVPADVARKKPGTSARFAPGGNAVVWGQSGIGPHSKEERHYIPSIGPYLQVLDAFAARLKADS
ncbi:MAG: M20/M25/M40 family metallo-hydrolase [Acidobacteriota bacterium]